jgi:hypothetical protein
MPEALMAAETAVLVPAVVAGQQTFVWEAMV